MLTQLPTYLQVIVRQKDQVLFAGAATSVSAWNELGDFDILPAHQSFVSTIKQRIIIRRLKESPVELLIEGGLLRVQADQLEIYLFKSNQL
jgi:F0F1-type ATP synthase epsilon subunit